MNEHPLNLSVIPLAWPSGAQSPRDVISAEVRYVLLRREIATNFALISGS